MSYKLASYISLVFFFAIGLFFFIDARNLPEGMGYDIGAGFFPSILSFIMMIFCVVGIFTTWRKKEDSHVEIPKLANLVITIGISVAFVLIWAMVGYFYLTTFIMISILIYIFNPEERSYKKISKTLLISFSLLLIIYVVFGLILNFRF